jgi:hypothetical protein
MALPRRRSIWLLGLAFVLALAGCGSSDGAGDGGHAVHAGASGHDMEAMAVEPIELAGAKVPRLALTATPDPMGGFNLRVRMANFRLAPGDHALRVEAVANNHAPYHHDGEPVFATAAVSAG